ncbi:uncharacterized protein [Nicotiana sylvestris]|uniref:uncharacterized protein n=1 Tax=Nicotiana sylvestris TaxID=4096 RepID=UPI00388C6072
MASYEALYRRRHRSPVGWFEPGKAKILGTDLVQVALDKVSVIQEWLLTAQSRQKSYEDRKVRDVSYMVGKKVLLKVSPMKGFMSFGKKVFNISMLRKYFGDPSRALDFSMVQLIDDLTYDVELVAILERKVQKFRSKDIASVKV